MKLSAIVFALLALLPIDVSAGNNKKTLAWVTHVDERARTVRLQTAIHKIDIECAPDGGVDTLTTNIVEVEFRCVKNGDGRCDFISPYEFFVRGKPAKILRRQFLKKLTRIRVAKDPGDNSERYKRGLMIHGTINKEDDFFMQLRIAKSNKNAAPISSQRKLDRAEVVFPEEKPYKAYVNGVEMDIVVFTVNQ